MSLTLKPWEQRFNGRTWHDMPGSKKDDKRMNFALYRRGKLTEADIEAWEEDQKVKETTGKCGTTRAKRVLGPQKGRAAALERLRLAAEQRELAAIVIPRGDCEPAAGPEAPVVSPAIAARTISVRTTEAEVPNIFARMKRVSAPARRPALVNSKLPAPWPQGRALHCSKYLLPWM